MQYLSMVHPKQGVIFNTNGKIIDATLGLSNAPSKTTNLVIGLTSSVVAVFTLTLLTRPSLPTDISFTRPKGHDPLGEISSMRRAKSQIWLIFDPIFSSLQFRQILFYPPSPKQRSKMLHMTPMFPISITIIKYTPRRCLIVSE